MIKPKIIRNTVVIDKKYLTEHRNPDTGKLYISIGSSDSDNGVININRYVIGRDLPSEYTEKIQKIIDSQPSEARVIAHESQHLHNNEIGWNPMAWGHSMMEIMMLGLYDELGASVAGDIAETGPSPENIFNSLANGIKRITNTLDVRYMQQFFSKFEAKISSVSSPGDFFTTDYNAARIMPAVRHYLTINNECVLDKLDARQQKIIKMRLFSLMNHVFDFAYAQCAGHRKTKQNQPTLER